VIRSVLKLTLVSLLATCPVICGSEGAVLGLRTQHTAAHSASTIPSPAPANDDDCVCNGALIHCHSSVRIADLNPDSLPLDLHSCLDASVSTSLQVLLTSEPHSLPNRTPARGVAMVTLLPVARC
jgi:hypothetical protein